MKETPFPFFTCAFSKLDEITITRNLTYFLILPFHVIKSVFDNNLRGSILTLRHVGVIQNQGLQIRRFNGRLENLEC